MINSAITSMSTIFELFNKRSMLDEITKNKYDQARVDFKFLTELSKKYFININTCFVEKGIEYFSDRKILANKEIISTIISDNKKKANDIQDGFGMLQKEITEVKDRFSDIYKDMMADYQVY